MMTIEEIREFRNTHNPYCQRNGIVVEELRPGYGRTVKTVTEEDLNVLHLPHGGVYFAMADTACGSAMAAYGKKCVTVDASYHFLRGAKVGDSLSAEARELRHGNLLSVLNVQVKDQEGTLLGSGEFTFCTVE